MDKLSPFSEERPWGGFREFIKNKPSTVKILFIKKGELFSLQKHQDRSEFWRILSGDPDVTIGDKTIRAKAGDEFNISSGTDLGANHRAAAPINDVEILEISIGNFDENDIIRIKDKYGRI